MRTTVLCCFPQSTPSLVASVVAGSCLWERPVVSRTMRRLPCSKAQEVLGVRGEGLGRAVLRRSVHCTAASERKCSDLSYIVELTLIASMKVQILKRGYCPSGLPGGVSSGRKASERAWKVCPDRRQGRYYVGMRRARRLDFAVFLANMTPANCL